MFLHSESIDGFPKKSKSSFVLPKIFPGVYEIPQNNWTRSGEHKRFHKSMDTQTKDVRQGKSFQKCTHL